MTIIENKVSWMKKAACRGIDPGLFYIERGDGSEAPIGSNRMAINVCKSCPVRLDCLLTAIANKEDFGIWGGVPPRDRRPSNAEKTIQRVKDEIEYARIMELEPATRRKALAKHRK